MKNEFLTHTVNFCIGSNFSKGLGSALSEIPGPLYKVCRLKHATDVDTSNLAAKSDFIALKAEIDKLDINELVHAPTSLNDLKTKVDDLDVGQLQTVCEDLKK